MPTYAEFEAQKQECRDRIAKRDKVRLLLASKEFKELILQDFIINESARMAACCGDQNLSDSIRQICLVGSQSGGFLKRYLQTIETNGYQAECDLKELEEIELPME